MWCHRVFMKSYHNTYTSGKINAFNTFFIKSHLGFTRILGTPSRVSLELLGVHRDFINTLEAS